jgi:predicted O-methyltransferase YrrM
MDFYSEYEQRCANTQSDIHAHLPALYHYASVGDAQIIELGVRGGDSTVAFLAAIQTNGGYLWSCDVNAPPFANAWQTATPQWEFVHGDDLERFPYAPDQVDVVFIDTSHTYHQTVAELDLYHAKVRPGGVILLHDTELRSPADSPASDPPFPVRQAVQEFAEDYGWELELIPGCYGLGILHAPEVDDD